MASIERAELLLMQQRNELAERELRGVLAEDPQHGRAHSLLALSLLEDASRWQEATDEAQAAIAIDPDEAFAHFVLGQVYLTRSRHAEAKAAAQEAIRLDPYDANSFGLLAGVEMIASQWSAALESATRGLEVDPENVQCSNLRSIALERLGRDGEALLAAEETLRRSPENSMSHAAMGWTALNSGDHQRAQLAFREALRLDPNNELARDGLISALNSRSFLFRSIHRFYIWLSRFSAKYQFAIVFGAWLLIQVLQQVQRTWPSLRIVITPILLMYLLFVITTWIATSLFNTFLRFHSFGRLLLKRREIWASNFITMCVSAAVLGSLYGGWQLGISGGAAVLGYWLLMMIPVSAIFNQRTGTRTAVAVAATLLVGSVPVLAIGRCLMEQSYEPMSSTLPMFGWGILAIQIVSSIAQATPVRR